MPARSKPARRATRDLVNALPKDVQPQELVVTLLGAYVREDTRPVWSGGLVALLDEFGFSNGAARITLSRLVNRQLLARIRDGRFVYYTPTPRTMALIREGDRRIFELGMHASTGKDWTLLWYSLPEDLRVERHRLSRRLRFLGFGPVEDSTWVCPRDERTEVCEILEVLGLTDRAALFVGAEPATAVSELLDRAWDLPRLVDEYATFVEAFSPYRDAVDELADEQAFIVRTLLMDSYRQFPFLDPDLPAEIAPAPARRAEAVATFHELWPALEAPAQRHFDAVARTGTPASA